MKRFTTAAAALIGVAALFLGMSLSASADHGGGKAAAGAKAHGPLNSLVTAGTITQADATAVKAALKAARSQQTEIRAEHKSARAAVLAKLVAAGTITAAVAELIQAGNGELRSAMQAGTVTYAQLAAVRAAMIANRPAEGVMKNVVATVTAKLVADGTLTAAKAEAINAAVAAKAEANKSKRLGMKSNHGKASSDGPGHGFKGEGFKGQGRNAMRS